MLRGIVETLGDSSTSNILVREIRYSLVDASSAIFIYTNETLPKDGCPTQELDDIIKVSVFFRS